MTTSASTERTHEVEEKLARVRGLLEEADLDGALLTAQSTVAWVTAGLEDAIVRGADPGLVWALVTREAAYLVTQNIEGPRVEGEEGAGELGFEVATFPWWEDGFGRLVGELCDPKRLGNDGAGPGRDVRAELQRLRLVLTAGEQRRMRELGAEGCACLEAAVRTLGAGMTERDVAAEIADRLERAGIFPSVLLVGGDARRRTWRHPAVSSAAIERDVLAVIVGVRGGLNAACSRTVSLVPDATLAERHRVACEVEAREIAATRPGATYGEALQAGVDAYEALGYPGEWRHHYQGGPIGYGPREFNPAPLEHADAFSAVAVATGHACAWNPTVQGAKSEDTFLVGEDGAELVTNSSEWPTLTFDTPAGPLARPAILELGG